MLEFFDGNLGFDNRIATKSELLSNVDSSAPVPMTAFSLTAGNALVSVVLALWRGRRRAPRKQSRLRTNKSALQLYVGEMVLDALTPDVYASTLQLCDYLQMDADVIKHVLAHLGSPAEGGGGDPLARLRVCYERLPSLCTMLQHWLQIGVDQELQPLLNKLTSSHDTAATAAGLTYRELNLCDGHCFTPKDWGHLHLSSFGAQERARRAAWIATQVARTKTLREQLPTKSSSSQGESLDIEFTAAVFAGDQTTVNKVLNMDTFVLSKKVLDLSMWRAVNEGRIDVAEQLFNLGATPTLMKLPNKGNACNVSAVNETSIHPQFPYRLGPGKSMTEYKSTLMLATYNDDLSMMDWLLNHGCDVNLNQPSYVWSDGYNFGEMCSLSMCQSNEAMKMLLSRGANAKNKYIASSQYEECFANISVLLHLVGGHNSSGEMACFHEDDWNEPHNSPLRLSLAQLLVQHGADVNESVVDNDGHKLQLLAYWPNLIVAACTQTEADASSRLAWCEQLLTKHGADANWPCNSVAKSTFVPKGFAHGNTVLVMAVLRNNMALVKLLLRHGANPNQYEVPHWGKELDEGGTLKSFERCCEFDATLFGNNKYQSPLSVATKQNNKKMVQLLESHGANTPSEVDMEGYKLIYPCPLKGVSWKSL